MFSASSPVDRIAPLWSPTYERDSCGVGLVVDIAGRPSREIVSRALAGLVNLTHRGGVGADSRTGDGAGVLTQIPLAIFGLADDAVMVTWLAGSVLAETERFLEWEARRSSVIPGHVVP